MAFELKNAGTGGPPMTTCHGELVMSDPVRLALQVRIVFRRDQLNTNPASASNKGDLVGELAFSGLGVILARRVV